MLRGLLAGSASGLALCALLIGTASLVSPRPVPETHRPGAARPVAPVLRDQAEAAPRMPDALPRRGSGEAAPDLPPVTAGAAPPAEVPAGPSGGAPRIDEAAAVSLPIASAFNRPREDGEVVTPASDPVARKFSPTGGPRVTVPAPPQDARPSRTQSAARPVEARVEGFSAAPRAGQGPTLPRSTADEEPLASASAPPVDVLLPAPERTLAIDTGVAAPSTAGQDTRQSSGDTATPATGARRPILLKEGNRLLPPSATGPATGGEPSPAADDTGADATGGGLPRQLELDSTRAAAPVPAQSASDRPANPPAP